MGNPEQPRARFAPIPIETTFSSNRKSRKLSLPKPIPNPELTPEPSPRSPSPAFAREQQKQQQQQQEQQRERHRFHPQLIETSRRSRRVGDHGPATRPTDKTDITPYTNHIYSAKPRHVRRKLGCTLGDDEHVSRHPPSQRETVHEDFNGYLLDLAAKEAERQLEEAALAAFPNSRAREGGVAHFYFRDGSGSENSPEGTPPDEDHQIMPRPRRKSSNLGLNWWHKHMQEHAMHLAHDRGDEDQEQQQDDHGDDTEVEEPTAAAEAATATARTTATAVDDQATSPVLYRTDSDLDKMDFDLPPDPMWTTTKARTTMDRGRPLNGPPAEESPGLSHAPASHTSPEAGRQKHDPFGRPFGNVPLPVPGEAELLKLRKLAAPPMLGKELVFRTCPSPKLTKLETDHPFDHHVAAERCRDLSGQSGLWRGYCCRSESANNCIVPAELRDPAMLMTPQTPATPHEQACVCAGNPIIEEPASIWGPNDNDNDAAAAAARGRLPPSSSSSSLSPEGGGAAAAMLWTAEKRRESTGPTGLHQLHGLGGGSGGGGGLGGLGERLQREKAQAERDEKISQEFGEDFVTQVYNYLSLGYPAMAREFDEELCRITRVSVDELRRDDAKQMAKGHMLEVKLYEADGDKDDRCPRWLALRIYITEWARQHPDLDSLDPLAWGVRERRGSWAI